MLYELLMDVLQNLLVCRFVPRQEALWYLEDFLNNLVLILM